MKLNMNKLYSRLSAVMLLFSALAVTSCSDLLEESADEVLLNPETLNTVDALEAVVSGTYTKLLNSARWSDFLIMGYGGDDITTHSAINKIGFREADWRRQTTLSQRIARTYTGCYDVVTGSNIAINARENIEGDQETIDRLIGEAHFLRGFAYMYLTMTYGRVPIQLESNSNAEIPRAEFIDVYTQIESDFLQAESLLPDVYPNLTVIGSRPSTATAKAFLARLYLYWGGFPLNDQSKYALAAAKAKEVIDNEALYGYGLVENVGALFTEAGRFNQNEGVFTLVSCVTCGLANRTMGRLGMPPEARGWSETFGEIAFFEDMQADAALNGTEKRFNDTFVLEVIPRNENPVGAEWKSFSDPHPILRKVTGGDLTEPGTNNTVGEFNRYFMRYAEVLLTYAEATGRSGGNDAMAWTALNRVRNRAGATAELTSGDGSLADLAFLERKWELAGESLRMTDLVRTQTLGDALLRRNQGSQMETADEVNNIIPATGGENLYFSPIPQAQLDIAPWLND